MTESAQTLESVTRWVGLMIALAGALVANPDATARLALGSRDGLWGAALRTRGLLARFIPSLRQGGTVQAVAGNLAAAASEVSASARGFVGWGPEATVEHKLDMLLQRTLALDTEVAEIRAAISRAEHQHRADLVEAVDNARRESDAIRQSVEDLRADMVHSDASALPIVVVGLLLSGAAPDLARLPMWLGVSILLTLVVLAGFLGWVIVRQWHVRQHPPNV